MSDDAEDVTPRQNPGPDDPDGFTLDDVQPRDGYLDILLSAMNGFKDELEGSFGVTLVVGGSVVSGTAIGRKEWIRLFVESLQDNGADFLVKVLGDTWPDAQKYFENDYDRRDALNLRTRKRAFIHLKDARVHNGATHKVGLWRGSLDSVDGWSMGSYTDD